MTLQPGPTNSLTDIAGLKVGHSTRRDPGWLTGTTVILAPHGGAVCGVDVRGGGPGTRETDLLDPRNLVDRVNAVMLGGGSALGLAAADGIVQSLLADGHGWQIGGPGQVVPIVPGAILFDLGRGGTFDHHPTREDGEVAYASASDGPVEQGGRRGRHRRVARAASRGASDRPAWCSRRHDGRGDRRGQLGRLAGRPEDRCSCMRSGTVSTGSSTTSGCRAQEDVAASRAYAERAGREGMRPAMATTIGLIATDATLTKAQCQKVAGIGHDGMARAINPVHTLFDGDTLFTMATGARPNRTSPSCSS